MAGAARVRSPGTAGGRPLRLAPERQHRPGRTRVVEGQPVDPARRDPARRLLGGSGHAGSAGGRRDAGAEGSPALRRGWRRPGRSRQCYGRLEPSPVMRERPGTGQMEGIRLSVD